MNYITNSLKAYSSDLNDYANYLAPIGSMVASGMATGNVNTLSSFVSTFIQEPALELSKKLEKHSSLVDKGVAIAASAIAATTINQLFKEFAPLDTVVASLVGSAAAYLATERLAPSRILPYLPLPTTIAVSCMIGEVANRILRFTGIPQDTLDLIGGLGTMLSVWRPAMNDLLPKFVQEKIQQNVRELSDGRFIINGKVVAPLSKKVEAPKVYNVNFL